MTVESSLLCHHIDTDCDDVRLHCSFTVARRSDICYFALIVRTQPVQFYNTLNCTGLWRCCASQELAVYFAFRLKKSLFEISPHHDFETEHDIDMFAPKKLDTGIYIGDIDTFLRINEYMNVKIIFW